MSEVRVSKSFTAGKRRENDKYSLNSPPKNSRDVHIKKVYAKVFHVYKQFII